MENPPEVKVLGVRSYGRAPQGLPGDVPLANELSPLPAKPATTEAVGVESDPGSIPTPPAGRGDDPQEADAERPLRLSGRAAPPPAIARRRPTPPPPAWSPEPSALTVDEERAPLQVAVSGLRCPFCHDAVPLEERCACAECLAVHHLACWQEHPRCAACAGEHQLIPTGKPAAPLPERPKKRPRLADFPLPDPCYPAAAATYLGVTLHELNQLISEGDLMARQVQGEVVFRADAVRQLRPRVEGLRIARPKRVKQRSWRTVAHVSGSVLALLLAMFGVFLAFLGPVGLVIGAFCALPAFFIYLLRV